MYFTGILTALQRQLYGHTFDMSADNGDLLAFKAGRVEYDEETKRATPKRGQGMIRVARNRDDPMLYMFTWEPRGSYKNAPGAAALREELVLFPGDARWEHIPQCETGRVYSLRFKSSGQKEMFWMQEPPTDLNELHEPTPRDLAVEETFNQYLDPELYVDQDEDEEVEDVPAAAPASGPAAEEEPSQQGPQANVDVAALLRSINVPGQDSQQEVPVLSLDHAISQSTLAAHVNSLSDEELVPLYEFLPSEIPHTRSELVRVIQSSQFAQGMGSLSSVLNQAGLGQLVSSQLGYNYTGEGVEGFLQGVRQSSKQPESDDMAVDESSEQPTEQDKN